ncbi:unnamed protein product [Gongylonema pulchrum]|uniref:Secreted protein n=1 Tax=Gongylonema pulchrum TaxID=637853 RepID=A0A183CXN9_9BILA|nr:unnamed protein product [Gongylonema pulchrum]
MLLQLLAAGFFTAQFAYVEMAKALRGAFMMKGASESYALSDGDLVDEMELEENELEKQFGLLPEFGRLSKESIFEQGETRDFLQFLRNIQYDHRQLPENDNGEAVDIHISIVISNIRAVSEVNMVCQNQLPPRNSTFKSCSLKA